MFDDLSGKMAVPNIGGKRETLTVRDDHLLFTRMYFLAKKLDAANAFESFLAEVRADGKPNKVESSPQSLAGVERSVYRELWEEATQSEIDVHMKTETFHIVDRVPEGRKYVSSK